jgi:predicted TIM-barrel fold metal-dependent hydrolase
MIIDTHLHTIDRERLSYPWLVKVPTLNRNFSHQGYEAEAKRCGITQALHMEVDVAEADIENESVMVAEFAAKSGSLVVGTISACRPESADFAHFLERQIANPIVKGLRRVLHDMPDELSTTAVFRDNIKRMSGSRLPFDLVVFPHQLPQAIALVDHCPDVQFVLDHLANPPLKQRDLGAWTGFISEIARRPNICVKISGMINNADREHWQVDDLRPAFEHCVSAFGWDRVVWGSDWPVVTLGGTLSTWVGATHALLSGASLSEKHGLLAGNAQRIWRL